MNNAASLAKLKKDELVELCKQHGISGYSKLKKDELVALLTQTMGDGAASETEAGEAASTEAAAAPAEAPAAEAAPAPEGLARYCIALVNLWGIAPAAMIAAVYNQQQGASVTSADVIAAAACPVKDEDLIHANIAEFPDRINALRKKQATYTHYVPSASQIDIYLDNTFREKTHEFGAMRDFMVRAFNMRTPLALANTLRILQYLDDEFDVNQLMGMLASSGARFENEQQFRNVAVLLSKLKSVSRFWSFCGHTPEEAANFEPNKSPVRAYKVGRNDPCPCGSGKKYKKCCGR